MKSVQEIYRESQYERLVELAVAVWDGQGFADESLAFWLRVSSIFFGAWMTAEYGSEAYEDAQFLYQVAKTRCDMECGL